MTAVMYQVTSLTCSFIYGMGLQSTGIKQLVTPITLYFLHVRPVNQQPTTTGVELCHKVVGHPWFTETRVIRYQPFVVIHNTQFHSQCYTNDKGCNQTCENNIIPPTNIQYLKIRVRN